MKFLPLLLVAAATVCTGAFAADVIPADKLTDWTPGVAVGVPGGIPTNRTHLIDVTATPYFADKTGATDSSGAIQAAVNGANANDIVYLPTGTYRIDNMISIGSQKSNITVRGDGSATIIDCRTSNYGFAVGTSFSFNWPPSGVSLTSSTLVKGATTLPVPDSSQLPVGELVLIDLGNDPGLPVVSVFGYDLRATQNEYQGMRRQITRVTAKTATSVTISPGLYGDYTGAPAAVMFTSQFHTTGIGIEDMLIDCRNGSTQFPVGFDTCFGCWARNVKVQYSANYGFYMSASLNCEIRHCWVDQAKTQGASNHGGILVNTGAGCLIEDNVIAHNFPSMEINHGSCGNVFAYNFCYDSNANGTEGVSIDTNHGPHNSYNLYEGNIAPNVQADGYFGGASQDVLFRNWLHGMEPGLNGPGWTVSLNRFTRYYSLAGNILGNKTYPTIGVSLGNPNMGNGAHTGDAPPWTDGFWNGVGSVSQSGNAVSASVATFTSSNVGWYILTPNTSVMSWITSYIDSQHVTVSSSQTLANVPFVVSPGPSGYQELDGDVAKTLLRVANYNFVDNAIPASESPGTSTLPNSLYRAGAPAWFGGLAWPAIDPLASNPNPVFDSIPAGYRFVHGSDPGTTGTTSSGTASGTGSTSSGSTSVQQQKPINVRISI